ncbi:MAG: family 78 glycoside hydrolase catalytic domain [Lentisphaerae bacterium]|nr:family 78 glycoside hydrolase catalytic domain [Lentisphaerota bacterium]
MSNIEQAAWIWTAPDDCGKDIYRSFHRQLNLPELPAAPIMVEISADSTFELLINHRRCPLTQFSDYPNTRTYTTAEVSEFFQPGRNEITIIVHYIGVDSYTYLIGKPYLKVAFSAGAEILCLSDSSWLAGSVDSYDSKAIPVTFQLGLQFCYHAGRRNSGDGGKPAYQYSAAEAEYWQSLRPRPIPPLLELPRPQTSVCQQGYLKRAADAAAGDQPAPLTGQACYRDWLRPEKYATFFTEESLRTSDNFKRYDIPRLSWDSCEPLVFAPLPEDSDGYYLIIDLGKESAGFLTFKFALPEGTRVDIAHGEHLDDGRVRGSFPRYDFADRYYSCAGVQEFTYCHRRLGARYLELHFTDFPAHSEVPLQLYYVGIVPVEVPLPPAPGFHCEDRMLLRINEVAVATLKLCMHEHYEDCPWREQALWTYDARMQMLYGYYLWGNYDYAAASLNLVAQTYDGGDYLGKVAPALGSTRPIPSFTLVWVPALYEHYLHSGSLQLCRENIALADVIIDKAISRQDPEYGLYFAGTDETIWHFYEWVGRLNQLDTYPQSLYNVYFYECLQAAAKIHAALGNQPRAAELRARAAELGQKVEKLFWEEELGWYGALLPGQNDLAYEHVQAVMLANDLVPAEKLPRLKEALLGRKLLPNSFGSFAYFLAAMMKTGPAGRAHISSCLQDLFTPIVLADATSLWETAGGSKGTGGKGSLCHAWSSVMPYFCSAYVLGIRPRQPGFREFLVQPYPAHLTHAEGGVPTPAGEIRVSWQLQGDGLTVEVSHPQGLTPVLEAYPEYPILKTKLIART